jgi:hypothetical protein
MLINMGGKHRIMRDEVLKQVIGQIGLFNDAAKSDQVSRLRLADAGLSTIRDFLRILSDHNIKLLNPRRYGVATTLLAEVGAMTGEWIRKMEKKRGCNG